MEHTKLKDRMTELGTNPRKLAPVLGICYKTMLLKMNGKLDFKYQEVITLCKILDIANPRDYFAEK